MQDTRISVLPFSPTEGKSIRQTLGGMLDMSSSTLNLGGSRRPSKAGSIQELPSRRNSAQMGEGPLFSSSKDAATTKIGASEGALEKGFA